MPDLARHLEAILEEHRKYQHPCRLCGRMIYYLICRDGGFRAYTADGGVHFGNCRRQKEAEAKSA